MAKALLLFASLLVLSHGSLARQLLGSKGECLLNRLDALEPDRRVQSEAGETETWNPNHEQFQCAGVAVVRRTIQPNGLLLPFYSNSPQLIYIVQGRGITGVLFPGCPETFQEAQLGSRQGRAGSRRVQDQHQRIGNFRAGDVIALPAGVAHWSYNNGNEPVVAVTLLDTSNTANQLDNYPRNFFIAGNGQEEFPQREESEYRPRSPRRFHERQQQQGSSNNVFAGMDTRLIAEAFNVDENVARRLRGENDVRGNIVQVREGELQVVRPPGLEEERQEQESERRRSFANGLEETICSLRFKENLGDPSRADVYTPEAGRLSTVNSQKLPILQWLQLSAERGVLENEALLLPHWNLNANSIIYAIRGRARIQVVDNNGQNVFNGELNEGQVLTVPQNFAVVKRSESERFEWITFKTNDNAITNSLAGRTSALRALPLEVLANAYQISIEEARRIKFNRPETHLASSRSSPSSRWSIV